MADKINKSKIFPNIGALLVSKMITEENKEPRFMYREKRMNSMDSGWRIFSGYEDEDYTADPSNIGVYAAEVLIEIEPTLEELLLKGVGSVYERRTENTPWYKVHDFSLEDDYMSRVQLTKSWSFDINNLFERTIEKDGALMYTTDDKTVRFVAWNSNDDRDTLHKIYSDKVNNRDESISKTLKKYDLSNEKMDKLGYLITERNDDKEYQALYTFSFVDKSILYSVFYFDESEDSKWAISTWESITSKV